MRYYNSKRRDTPGDYFPLPKAIFRLGLGAGEIAVLAFLMYCEDRKTYQCHPSYSTIGSACGMSNNTVKKYVGSLVRKGFLCTMIVYHGTYFQNWLNASYSPPNKFILFLSWSILFALFVLIFHSIKRSNKTNQLCLLLFILQFFSFFVFFISLSCFAAYLVALVNNIFTLIISVWLMVALWKNGHRASVLLLVPFIVYLLFQLFICFLWYSLAYGEWKN